MESCDVAQKYKKEILSLSHFIWQQHFKDLMLMYADFEIQKVAFNCIVFLGVYQ